MNSRKRVSRLSNLRPRSDRESTVIKLLIWQACFDESPRAMQRTLARLRSYIHKVQHQRAEAIDALTGAASVTMEDLAAAQRFSAKPREREPNSLPVAHSSRSEKRVLTEDEIIAKNWLEVADWKQKNKKLLGDLLPKNLLPATPKQPEGSESAG